MREITFIHGADLHLDSPMVGLRRLPPEILKVVQESTFQALEALVSAAISHSVDFVILAGDLFDQVNRSIRAQSRLKRQMQRLQESNIPVFIVHGNHDSLGGKFPHLDMPENVTIFPEQVESRTLMTKHGVTVNLYGFSYANRHVSERKITSYQKQAGADYHIGILHGNLEGSADHGNYAPFTIRELQSKDFDYWALGHIHKRSILSESPPIVYPGNTQGRHRKEQGPKGVYLVKLHGAESSLTFLPTSQTIWLEKGLDGSGWKHFDHLYGAVRQLIESEREEGANKLLSLRLTNVPSPLFQQARELEDFLETIQEEEEGEHPFVWPFELAVDEKVEWSREQLEQSTDFYGEMFRIMDHFNEIDKTLAPFYQHSSARKLVDELSDEEQRVLLQEAEQVLVKLLLKD